MAYFSTQGTQQPTGWQNLSGQGMTALPTIATPKPFTYSPAITKASSIAGAYNPNTFDYGKLNTFATTPVSWTPESIQNLYKTQFSDLQQAQDLSNQNISNTMKGRFQGRSGALVKELIDNAYGYNRSRENVLSDVLGQLLPQQEQLTQSRQAMGLTGEQTRQSGFGLAGDLLTKLATTELGAAGQTTAQKEVDIKELATRGDLDLRDKALQISEVAQNRQLNQEDQKIAIQTLDSAAQRSSLASQDAIRQGNYELAVTMQKEAEYFENQRLELEKQAQSFTQEATKQQLSLSALDQILTAAGIDKETARKIKETFSNLNVNVTTA